MHTPWAICETCRILLYIILGSYAVNVLYKEFHWTLETDSTIGQTFDSENQNITVSLTALSDIGLDSLAGFCIY